MAYVPSRVTNNGRGKRLSGFEYSHQHSAVAGEVPATSSLAPGDGDSNWYSGYIDDLRFVKGVAVYPAAFTPPVAQLGLNA